MSLTVGKLKEILATMNDDVIIRDEQNQNFIYISCEDETLLLSTSTPIGKCIRTGTYVFPSVVDGYTAFCPDLDEDLYDFEWEELLTNDDITN